MAGRRMDKAITDELRRLHDQLLSEMEEKGYAANTVKSYDEYAGNFIRYLEGEYEPSERGS